MKNASEPPVLEVAADTSLLIAEYQANLTLWQHDDILRQHRNTTFLNVNTLLLTVLAALTALKAPTHYLGATAIVFSIFGIAVSRVWHKVQIRNSEYIRFRRLQLKSIEARLPGVTTFENTYEAFYRLNEVTFHSNDVPFCISESAKARSTMTEGRLPTVVSLLWLTIGTTGFVAILVIYFVE
ncbi:MAG: hypothetical protein IPJ30_18975 [Acidobacteria bacterium]|nr:hypothetical protein [Acidobacteriota bacterium]